MTEEQNSDSSSSHVNEWFSSLIVALIAGAFGVFSDASTTRITIAGIMVLAASGAVYLLWPRLQAFAHWRGPLTALLLATGVFYLGIGLVETWQDRRDKDSPDDGGTIPVETPVPDKTLLFDGSTLPYPTNTLNVVTNAVGDTCRIAHVKDRLVFEAADVSAWQQCYLRIAPNRTIVSGSDAPGLGYLEANLSYEGANDGRDNMPFPGWAEGVAIYLELTTYTEDTNLAVVCGIGVGDEQLHAYFHVYAFSDAGLACSEGEPLAGHCDLAYVESEPLTPSATYHAHLEAEESSPGVFRCVVQGPGGQTFAPDDYFVSTPNEPFGFADLSTVPFQRRIRMTVQENRPAVFAVDDIYESR